MLNNTDQSEVISDRGENAISLPGVYAARNASDGVQLALLPQLLKACRWPSRSNSALLHADAASNALREHEPGQPTPSTDYTGK
jgi:hypothetical protein